MTDEQLIEFKNQSMQDGKLNLSKFAALVAAHEREACAKLCLDTYPSIEGAVCAQRIRARGQA